MSGVLPIIGAAGGLLSGVSGLFGTLNQNNRAQEEANQIAREGLADARQNAEYQRAVQALINRRSVAGTTDSFGSSLQYDPATNSWTSALGPLPQATQTAADQAAISRNTTDLRGAQFANQQAALRAARAGPMADAAQRELAGYRPMQAADLTSLLMDRATTANNQTFRPLVADTLRSFARTGTSAGPVLSQLGRANAEELRKSLIDSQIAGMSGVEQINQSRRQGLGQTAAETAQLANPQFQYSNVTPSTAGSTMASLLASRAQGSATAPAFGMSGGNQAQALLTASNTNLGKNIVDPNFSTNNLARAGSQLGSLMADQGPLQKLFAAFKPPTTNQGDSRVPGGNEAFG